MKHFLMALLLMSSFSLRAETSNPFLNPFKAEVHEDQNITLLNSGLSAFEERLQMIERAQKTIDIEYFIYTPDIAGRIFTHALIRKAQEGVKVRLLLDWFMVQKELDPFYAYELEKFGIEIKYYNPLPFLNFIRTQFRNHRKTLLVDGREFVTGGRNLADEYFDMDKDYNFLDRDIKVEGTIAQAVQGTFDEIWNSKLSRRVERKRKPLPTDADYISVGSSKGMPNTARNYQYDLEQWTKKVKRAEEFVANDADASFISDLRSKSQAILANEFSGTCKDMSFHSEYPIIGFKSAKHRQIKYEIADKMKNAKKSIIFDSPYFVTDNTSKAALEEALNNKIDVTLITNSLYSSDAVYVSTAFNGVIKNWIKKGLKPFVLDGKKPVDYAELTPDLGGARVGVHAKSYVFDDKDTVIGTYNFDPRSSNINAEMTITCDNNPDLAAAVSGDMQMRMKSSFLLDSPQTADKMKFYNVGLIKRIEFALLKLPSRLIHFLL